YWEAEPLDKAILAFAEKGEGDPDNTDVQTALDDLVEMYQDEGRYAEAEQTARRALAIREKVYAAGRQRWSDRGNLLNARAALAKVLQVANRIQEAEAIYRGDLADARDDSEKISAQTNLAHFLRETYRLAEAEKLYREVLAVDDGKKLGYGRQAFDGLGVLLTQTGRFAEAEAHYRQMRLSTDTADEIGGPLVSGVLGNFAALLAKIGKTDEAEALYRRALAVDQQYYGPDHPRVAVALNNLAGLLYATKRFAEAEPLHRLSLAIREEVYGPNDPRVATVLNNLALVTDHTKGHAQAEPMLRRALSIDETAYGPDHPLLAKTLNNLAVLAYQTNRPEEAEPLMRRALFIDKSTYGPKHPEVARDLVSLAVMRARQGDWVQAAALYARAKPALIGQTESTIGDESADVDLRKAMLKRRSGWLRLNAIAVNRAAAGSARARAEGFELAQWALQTDAAEVLVQMSARFSRGDGPLANLVRERESLLASFESEERRMTDAIGRKDVQALKVLYQSRDQVEVRLKDIEAKLAANFPQYARLANPKPLTVPATQALLRSDEALILFLNGPQISQETQLPEDTLAWVITRNKASWYRVPLDTQALTDEVTALRCGLDEGQWGADDSRARCWAVLKGARGYENFDWKASNILPFDPSRAHALYKALLEPAQGLISGKHLLIVPSGPLTSLPFGVLVTEPAAATAPATLADYREAAWLGTRQPISVLPSVASLAALRREAMPSAAVEPFIGYGDPALAGQPGCAEPVIPDRCPDEDIEVARSAHVMNRSALNLSATPSYFRGGLANPSVLRKACPLPDTAYELRCVARSLGADSSAIKLGEAMTETAVKAAPLDHYRIVHFATHGLLAGETAQFLKAQAEPALVMSPPAQPTEDDDGLLTASEIAGLKLDADWVVLSACNTAGGNEPGAEALSGLARAFFYAGARALLVSHWAVDSYAAAMLTSRTFAEMLNAGTIGRAEALRRAMLAFMADDQRPWAAHPSAWAPFFVVVGEGGDRITAPALEVAKPIAEPGANEPTQPAAQRRQAVKTQ
ncbi:MAG: CHAT domain-containing protein, partial [Hyphomicrobiaceae bacterium]|nr:CHAT domain-containing protein [Hyphomicrobiaceae bacterium]